MKTALLSIIQSSSVPSISVPFPWPVSCSAQKFIHLSVIIRPTPALFSPSVSGRWTLVIPCVWWWVRVVAVAVISWWRLVVDAANVVGIVRPSVHRRRSISGWGPHPVMIHGRPSILISSPLLSVATHFVLVSPLPASLCPPRQGTSASGASSAGWSWGPRASYWPAFPYNTLCSLNPGGLFASSQDRSHVNR